MNESIDLEGSKVKLNNNPQWRGICMYFFMLSPNEVSVFSIVLQ